VERVGLESTFFDYLYQPRLRAMKGVTMGRIHRTVNDTIFTVLGVRAGGIVVVLAARGLRAVRFARYLNWLTGGTTPSMPRRQMRHRQPEAVHAAGSLKPICLDSARLRPSWRWAEAACQPGCTGS
jgi:hypothetical protein